MRIYSMIYAKGGLCMQECGGHGICIFPAGRCSCFVGYSGSSCGDCSIGFVKSPASTTTSSWCIPITSTRLNHSGAISNSLSQGFAAQEQVSEPEPVPSPTPYIGNTKRDIDCRECPESGHLSNSGSGGLVSERLTPYSVEQEIAQEREKEHRRRVEVLVIAASVSAATPLLLSFLVFVCC